MARGEVSAARITTSAVPRFKVLVAVGDIVVSWLISISHEKEGLETHPRWHPSSTDGSEKPAEQDQSGSGSEPRRQ